MLPKLKQTYNLVLDLLFPIKCQRCGVEGDYLCLSCQQRIEPPLNPGPAPKELKGLIVIARYEDEAIRNLIWNLKYNSVLDIAKTLGLLMTDYLIKNDLQEHFATAAAIPVPLHKRRKRARGYNQAEEIARAVAINLELQLVPALKKIRSTARQVDLEKSEREKNLENAFATVPTPSLGDRRVLLIDDVASTGTTLNECAKALKNQGASEIWGLVVARK